MAEPLILRRRLSRRLFGCLGHVLMLPIAAFICGAVAFAPTMLVLRNGLGVEAGTAWRAAEGAFLLALAVAVGLLLRDGVRYVTASVSLAPGLLVHASGRRRDDVDLSRLAAVEAVVPLVEGPLAGLGIRSSDGATISLGDDWPLESVLAHLGASALPPVEAALDRLARDQAVVLRRNVALAGGDAAVLTRQVFPAEVAPGVDASDEARVRRLFPYLVHVQEPGPEAAAGSEPVVVVLAARREDAAGAVLPGDGAALVSCLLPRHRVLRLEDGRWGAAILPRGLAPIGKLCEHGEEHAAEVGS